MFAVVGIEDTIADGIWMFGGVLMSVALPVLSTCIRTQLGASALIYVDCRRYLALVMFSAFTALLLLAAYRAGMPDKQIAWYTALLAGYGWEATLERVAMLDPR